MYSSPSSENRRDTTASILSGIATEGEYIEHRSWFTWFDNLMAGAIKVVFSIGSAFIGMLKYMNDIKPKGFLTFIKIFTGPFWNIIDAVAYFFSGFNKIRHAKSFWNFFDGFFDIFMGLQLLTLTIVSLFVLPFIAQFSFAACMWHMTAYSFGKFIKNFSNKEESNLYNFLDFSAWLCASIGTTLLGIAPFCPIAALPIVIFYALAGTFKGIQAGIDLYKWFKNKFSNTSELEANHSNQDSMHRIKNYQSPTSALFSNRTIGNEEFVERYKSFFAMLIKSQADGIISDRDVIAITGYFFKVNPSFLSFSKDYEDYSKGAVAFNIVSRKWALFAQYLMEHFFDPNLELAEKRIIAYILGVTKFPDPKNKIKNGKHIPVRLYDYPGKNGDNDKFLSAFYKYILYNKINNAKYPLTMAEKSWLRCYLIQSLDKNGAYNNFHDEITKIYQSELKYIRNIISSKDNKETENRLTILEAKLKRLLGKFSIKYLDSEKMVHYGHMPHHDDFSYTKRKSTNHSIYSPSQYSINEIIGSIEDIKQIKRELLNDPKSLEEIETAYSKIEKAIKVADLQLRHGINVKAQQQALAKKRHIIAHTVLDKKHADHKENFSKIKEDLQTIQEDIDRKLHLNHLLNEAASYRSKVLIEKTIHIVETQIATAEKQLELENDDDSSFKPYEQSLQQQSKNLKQHVISGKLISENHQSAWMQTITNIQDKVSHLTDDLKKKYQENYINTEKTIQGLNQLIKENRQKQSPKKNLFLSKQQNALHAISADLHNAENHALSDNDDIHYLSNKHCQDLSKRLQTAHQDILKAKIEALRTKLYGLKINLKLIEYASQKVDIPFTQIKIMLSPLGQEVIALEKLHNEQEVLLENLENNLLLTKQTDSQLDDAQVKLNKINDDQITLSNKLTRLTHEYYYNTINDSLQTVSDTIADIEDNQYGFKIDKTKSPFSDLNLTINSLWDDLKTYDGKSEQTTLDKAKSQVSFDITNIKNDIASQLKGLANHRIKALESKISQENGQIDFKEEPSYLSNHSKVINNNQSKNKDYYISLNTSLDEIENRINKKINQAEISAEERLQKPNANDTKILLVIEKNEAINDSNEESIVIGSAQKKSRSIDELSINENTNVSDNDDLFGTKKDEIAEALIGMIQDIINNEYRGSCCASNLAKDKKAELEAIKKQVNSIIEQTAKDLANDNTMLKPKSMQYIFDKIVSKKIDISDDSKKDIKKSADNKKKQEPSKMRSIAGIINNHSFFGLWRTTSATDANNYLENNAKAGLELKTDSDLAAVNTPN